MMLVFAKCAIFAAATSVSPRVAPPAFTPPRQRAMLPRAARQPLRSRAIDSVLSCRCFSFARQARGAPA